jgi:hypothetical protein
MAILFFQVITASLYRRENKNGIFSFSPADGFTASEHF